MPSNKHQDSSGPHQEERKYRRFDLQFPVDQSFPSSGTMHELEAISRNVSIGGILLISNDSLPPRTRVSLTMDVRGPGSGRRVRLLGEGDVVRVQRLESGVGFAIAIQCQHPITEMENHLPAIG